MVQKFNDGRWSRRIDVADFVYSNITPYEGDASFLQAKQYLLSVRENYKGKDDIALEIKSRLDDIEAREKNKIKE